MVSQNVRAAGEHFSLYFTVLGDTYPQKHIVKSTKKRNFCILAERYATFSLSEASGASEPQGCLQEPPRTSGELPETFQRSPRTSPMPP